MVYFYNLRNEEKKIKDTASHLSHRTPSAIWGNSTISHSIYIDKSKVSGIAENLFFFEHSLGGSFHMNILNYKQSRTLGSSGKGGGGVSPPRKPVTFIVGYV